MMGARLNFEAFIIGMDYFCPSRRDDSTRMTQNPWVENYIFRHE